MAMTSSTVMGNSSRMVSSWGTATYALNARSLQVFAAQ
jgi:hypothetical protein